MSKCFCTNDTSATVSLPDILTAAVSEIADKYGITPRKVKREIQHVLEIMRTSLKDYLPLIVLLSLLMSGNSTTACPPSADIEISRVSDEVTSL